MRGSLLLPPAACRVAGWIAALLVCLAGQAAADGAYQRPRDPLFPWQWNLENRGQPVRRGAEQRGTPDADMDVVEAHAAGHRGGGVIVALIGLGFDYKDSTLANSLWHNPGEVPENGVDDDGNGWVDDVIGYDFAEHDGDPTFGGAHDRAVSEIGFAPHDDRTVAGIAPDARLMVLKIATDGGNFLLGPLPNALRYAVRNGARVIFMPWTRRRSTCEDPNLATIHSVFRETAEHAVIIGGLPDNWPACLPEVVAIQATDARDRPRLPAAPAIEFAVPGADGRSAVYPSNAIGAAAGVAALLFGQDPSRTPDDVRALLRATADRVHPELGAYEDGRSPLFGAGRINASRALGTDFDGDGRVDADDPDADGDGVLDREDPCPLDPIQRCELDPDGLSR